VKNLETQAVKKRK